MTRYRIQAWLAAAVMLAAGLPARAERWQLQYFHDEEKSSLHIADMAFPSAKRGVAVGMISEGKQERGVVLVTSDGGSHWTQVPTKEVGLSLFALNDQIVWMVTAKGIWKTNEAGRTWTKLPNSPKGALRVCFVDEQHGYAVGIQKGAFETSDGGKQWKAIAEAAKIPTEARYTVFSWVSARKNLIEITGWAKAPSYDRQERPAWMDPSAAIYRSETPGTLTVLQSPDSGKSWMHSSIKYRGRVTRVRYGPGLFGLWLFEFSEAAQYPSEVVRWEGAKNNLVSAFGSKQRKITDIWITPNGTAYMAGAEVKGELRTLPVPGKVKILRSTKPDFTGWTEMDVDYKAEASRTILAGFGESDLWAATDTGQILKLVP